MEDRTPPPPLPTDDQIPPPPMTDDRIPPLPLTDSTTIDDLFSQRITDIEVVLEPKVGTIFDSENEARECYATYAKATGFGAVTKTSRKREDGVKAYITYGCHRSRKPRTTDLDPIKSQPTTKASSKHGDLIYFSS